MRLKLKIIILALLVIIVLEAYYMYILYESVCEVLIYSFSRAQFYGRRIAYDLRLIRYFVEFIMDNNLSISEFKVKYPERYATFYWCCGDAYTSIFNLVYSIEIGNYLRRSRSLLYFTSTLTDLSGFFYSLFMSLERNNTGVVYGFSRKLSIVDNVIKLLYEFGEMKSWDSISMEFIEEFRINVNRLLKE